MTILVAYDGSDGADAAVASAAKLLGRDGADVVVLSVWEPLTVELLRAQRFGGPLGYAPSAAELDAQSEGQARQVADHGAEVAAKAGFQARAQAVADERDIADTIVAVAEEIDADAIVIGARGLAGIRAMVGSVSTHVVQHAHRPVLVVPVSV